ncbi:MAG: hypothetical protein ACRDNL_10090 [Spirillospora sp.]
MASVLQRADEPGEMLACCRLHRRYEREDERFLAFVGIAAALICHRRLTE